MTLADKQLALLGDPVFTDDERALLSCRRAAEFIFDGQYEEAREVLGRIWQGVGNRPAVDGLTPQTAAEALLQCGALTGRFGSSRHIAGAQEAAKDLLSEALRIFQTLARPSKISEVQYELGICYWRLGALDEARVVLTEALRGLTEADSELKAKISIRRTLIEISAHRYHEAWDILNEAEPVFETANDAWKGRWHNQKALVLLQLTNAERRSDYADRAIIEFTAAIFHYEQARHERFCGNSLNNFAFLLYKLARYAESHENLDRARNIFTRLKDTGSVAQVDETRARVFVAEGRYAEAKGVIAGAVSALREGEEQALLADALVVQGGVLARLGDHESSVSTLTEAMSIAETAGAPESAGHAALSLVEEHGRERLSEDELIETYRRADELLARTQDADDVARLRTCAQIVLSRLSGGNIPEGFSLPRAVRAYEARFIERALVDEGGSVSRAARRLGVKHQSLTHILQTRHRGLSDARTPVIPRKRSIIRVRPPRSTARYESPRAIRPAVILHVEDNRLVADAVKETLEMEGWQVEICLDGSAAVGRIEGKDHFDLLLLDHDLPDMTGLDIARRAKQLPHRRSLPVVILSGSDYAADAQLAGVDAFLQKPGGMKSLVETLTRLLDSSHRDSSF
jgi:CheY-like chemotaxis protein